MRREGARNVLDALVTDRRTERAGSGLKRYSKEKQRKKKKDFKRHLSGEAAREDKKMKAYEYIEMMKDFIVKAYVEYFSDLKADEEVMSLEEFAKMLGMSLVCKSNQKEVDMSSAQAKQKQHKRYEAVAVQVLHGRAGYKPAVKSRYSKSSNGRFLHPISFD